MFRLNFKRKTRSTRRALSTNYYAFTLAELLTAVLVISVIMVALAPVITKRMKDNVSVTTDNKKGLEVYTNPGTYTFDVPIGINTLFIQGSGGGGGGAGSTVSDPKTVTFTSNTTWKVPTGVNQVTFEITGSGGGGGGANGAGTGKSSCPDASNEFLAIRGASDESDLCYMRGFIDPDTSPCVTCYTKVLNPGDTCTTSACAWRYKSTVNSTTLYPAQSGASSNGAIPSNNRGIYTLKAAGNACGYYKKSPCNCDNAKYPPIVAYRLPTQSELQKIVKYKYEWSTTAGSSGLNLCTRDYPNYNTNADKRVTYCSEGVSCNGTQNGWCFSYAVAGSSGSRLYYDALQNSPIYGQGIYVNSNLDIDTNTATVKCVTALKRYNNYSASGGSSGAVLEKTINVLPNDTFEITIGQGGAGGASKTKGSQGGTTKIVHKRKNIELGTYYVKGGLGGNAATTSAHGSAYTNGTASNNTTPQGTCYSRNRKDTSDSFTGGNTSCTTISYSGESGSSTKGGNGGRVKNTGTINNGEASSGGYLYVDSSRTANQRATNEEIRLAKGQNASTAGFGGGGGLTPAWANSTSHFYQGGKGANGKVEITYKVALPGGGGGSSARVAGVDNNNKAYEIIYKVSEGDRIVFKVGSGGSGGIENQDGLNGSATVVGDNDIVFLAGEGGKTATDTDKNNLKGGRGGYTSYINEEDNIQSNIQTGIKLKSKTPPITYTINPPNNSFKGQNGTRGGVPEADTIQSGYTITNTIFSYGFNGGMGASPFNVEKSKTAASISCGGGIAGTLGQTTNLKYLCTSGNTKGNDARNHDPVNNEFGGSGGGGGGVKDDSFEQGAGGNGSSGYLRIRWDASEQE